MPSGCTASCACTATHTLACCTSRFAPPLHAPTRLRTLPNLAGTAVAAANFAFNQVSSVAAGWMQDTTLSTITLNGNPTPALQAGFCDGGSTVKTMWLDDMPALTTIHSGAFTGCVNLNFLQMNRGAVLE